MDIDTVTCQKDLNQESTPQRANDSSLHQEAYETKSFGYQSGPAIANLNLPGLDVIAQEGRVLGLMLDSGNAQFAAVRLQNDLLQLRPNRYAQNLLLNQVNLYDRKGIGSDLSLGYYNPYTASFSHGFIIPSVYRPFPTFPVFY